MGRIRNAMSYFGMADVDEDQYDDEDSSFDSDMSVPASPALRSSSLLTQASARSSVPSFNRSAPSRITTIHPKSYNDAQAVGRAVREGIPVILSLTDVSESVAYRIVDFAAGVVFGLRGSIERIDKRIFLLAPHEVSVSVEEPDAASTASHDLFVD